MKFFASSDRIKIDAARESQLIEQQRESSRNGLSLSVNHNYGSTRDAVSGAGKGDDAVSKGSSTLRAVDGVSQFLSGPTADAKLGNSKQSTSQQVIEETNRASTLSAGNDVNLSANNAVQVTGGQLHAGRDINVKGRDVTLDAARGSYSQETRERQSWEPTSAAQRCVAITSSGAWGVRPNVISLASTGKVEGTASHLRSAKRNGVIEFRQWVHDPTRRTQSA
nr:hemagglutinin repeat-containing protein [Pseudomonas syringae group genomosp. 3]